jgi:hypothetical protein
MCQALSCNDVIVPQPPLAVLKRRVGGRLQQRYELPLRARMLDDKAGWGFHEYNPRGHASPPNSRTERHCTSRSRSHVLEPNGPDMEEQRVLEHEPTELGCNCAPQLQWPGGASAQSLTTVKLVEEWVQNLGSVCIICSMLRYVSIALLIKLFSLYIHRQNILFTAWHCHISTVGEMPRIRHQNSTCIGRTWTAQYHDI